MNESTTADHTGAEQTSLPDLVTTKEAVKGKLLPWFLENRRSMPWRSNRTPYRVWISELMLQQTRVDQVAPYFRRFMKRFPSMKMLATASQDEVLKLWEGLGYYSRARNLHKAAVIIIEQHGGRFPRSPDAIRALPGIGAYTTAAIGSLAFNLDLAVVDGNVIRVLTRLTAYDRTTRDARAKKELQVMADDLLPHGHAADFNEAMMELGATVCTPKKPSCEACPFQLVCVAHVSGRETEFPIRDKKKKIPHIVVGAAVVINRRNQVLVAQRKNDAMLGGLWEFPGGKLEDGESITECIVRELHEELGIHIKTGDFLEPVQHAYSHFTMEMHTCFARIRAGRPRPIHCQDYTWLPVSELRSLPYSKADLKIIDQLEQRAASAGGA